MSTKKYAVAARAPRSTQECYNNSFVVIAICEDFDDALELSGESNIVVEVSDRINLNDLITDNGEKWVSGG